MLSTLQSHKSPRDVEMPLLQALLKDTRLATACGPRVHVIHKVAHSGGGQPLARGASSSRCSARKLCTFALLWPCKSQS